MKYLSSHQNNNLTELEVFGLSAAYNLADGHSYISAKKHFSSVLSALPALWHSAVNTPIPEMEKRFKNKFAEYFALEGLREHTHFCVCPTASNSIDIVGAWARAKHYKVGLVEPTFDNLAQLLRRREVALEAVPETMLFDLDALEQLILGEGLDALFLVNPNNPTGVALDVEAMSNIIALCHKHNVILILDTSFRFCHQTAIDEYSLLREAGLSFIVLEDTGKQWPTLDTKASLLSYSQDLSTDIRNIYEEIYLCCSNFSLRVIIEFIDATLKKGGISYMHSVVTQNIGIARSELEGTLVGIETAEADSVMSVMWLNIERTALSDLELTDYLGKRGVAVLPGRYFYWNSHHVAGHDRIRIALMKADDIFGSSIRRLKQALLELDVLSMAKNHRRVGVPQ